MRSTAPAVALLLILALVPGLAAQPAPGAPADPGLADLVRLLDTDESGIGRFYDVRWSEPRHKRLAALYDDLEGRLRAVQFGSLTPQGRIDYILLRDWLEHERAQLALQERWLVEMDLALPFRKAIQDLEWSRRKLEDVDPEAAAGAIAKIRDQVKKVRASIDAARRAKPERANDGEGDKAKEDDKPREDADDAKDDKPKPDAAGKPEEKPIPLKLSPTVALRAAAATDGLKRTLADWSRYYDQYKPDFAWWLSKPREEADKALADYAKYLRETVAGIKGEPDDPLIGDPIGEEALAADLRKEMIAYTPTELIAIADREFAWCEAEMKKAASEMGLKDDWKAALAKVKQDHVPPGEQDALVRALAREAIAWLKAGDRVTIPPLCEETWRIEMLSQETQKSLPFAVYGGQHVGVAYPTQGMPHDDKLMSMRGNNRRFTRIVTPHELIPGHHLQGFMAARERPYRRQFSTPFLVEGWALYWEMLMYDAGWGKSPEDRIGMLFWRMHRCARITVSLKFHLGQMTPAEMVDYLVDRVGHERFGARSEVRRFIGGDYSPLYQCGYMIGGLQLRALAKDVVGSGAMTEKQFNDAVLTYGPIPIELIRAGIKGLPLTADSRAEWRFGG